MIIDFGQLFIKFSSGPGRDRRVTPILTLSVAASLLAEHIVAVCCGRQPTTPTDTGRSRPADADVSDPAAPTLGGNLRPVFAFDYWPASSGRLPPATAHAIADLVDRRGGLSDHLQLDFEQAARREPTPGFIGVTVRDTPCDRPILAGYAQISAGNGIDLIETVTDELRSPGSDPARHSLDAAVLDAAIDAQSLYHPGVPALWWTDTDARSELLAEQRGLDRQRLLLQMDIDLPASTRSTIATRSFRPGDTDDVLRVNNAAFADHSEQGSWTRTTFEQRAAEPWFEPEGLRVATADGQLVGFCWTKIHRVPTPAADDDRRARTDERGRDTDVGEIYVIAVDPAHGGRGLGTQLVLAGLEQIERSGVTAAMLFVDADNDRAVKLYRRLGFVVGRSRSAYGTAST